MQRWLQLHPPYTSYRCFCICSLLSALNLQGACSRGCNDHHANHEQGSNGNPTSISWDDAVSSSSASSTTALSRSTAGFCFNCCAPIDPLQPPGTPCDNCYMDPASTHMIALLPERAQSKRSSRPAAVAMRQARRLMREVGLPGIGGTMLVYQDPEEEDAAMLGHRSLLPPAHERPERLLAIMARLKASGVIGELGRRLRPGRHL
jgi:hypothetical protein